MTGVSSNPSAIAKIIIDTTAPSAPVVTSPITGTSTTNPTPTFAGNGEAGAKVTIKDEANNVVCTTIVPSTGPWSCPFTVPQTEGKHTYLVYQTDLAGNSSANSAPVIITFDIDTDSAPLAMENAGPNAGDSNGDGVLDSNQGNVATKPDTANGNLYATLDLGTTGCNSITNFDFTPEAPLATQDAPYDYPIGLFIFKAKCATPGETLNITFVLDKVYNTSNWLYRKYNSVTRVYTNLPGVTYGTRLVGGVAKTTINFSVVEGGPYDEDGVANGTFSDPSGPTIPVATVVNSPASAGPVIIINTNQSSSSNSSSSSSSSSAQPVAVNNQATVEKDTTTKNPIQKVVDQAFNQVINTVLPRTGGDSGTLLVGIGLIVMGLSLAMSFLKKRENN